MGLLGDGLIWLGQFWRFSGKQGGDEEKTSKSHDSKIDNGRERTSVEARAANQRAIDIRLRHQAADVIGLHTATIQDAAGRSRACAELLANLIANETMRARGDLRGGNLAGAYGPAGLIGDCDFQELIRSQSCHAT